jgi:hypothetical protein
VRYLRAAVGTGPLRRGELVRSLKMRAFNAAGEVVRVRPRRAAKRV